MNFQSSNLYSEPIMSRRRPLSQYSAYEKDAPIRDEFDESNSQDSNANEETIYTFEHSLIQQWNSFLRMKYYMGPISICLVLISVIIIILINRFNLNAFSIKPRPILETVLSMRHKFKFQKDSTWFDISTGLENLQRNPARPAVFMLVSDESSIQSLSCVVETISKTVNIVFPDNQGWLLVEGKKLASARTTDPGILMDSISRNMNHSKVVVVSDVEKIPALLAQGFHFLVDQFNPTVAEAVYVFTLINRNFKNDLQPIEVVQEILTNTWKNLDDDIKWPLIIRVTETVIQLRAEKAMGHCPLKTASTIEISF